MGVDIEAGEKRLADDLIAACRRAGGREICLPENLTGMIGL
jgi:hypothetical protein